MDELKFQYFAIKPKVERPIKGLPCDSKTEDLHNDLTQLGYTVDKVSQLIGRKTKQPLPIFLVSLPRNIHNAKIFDLTKVSYMNVTVDGYDGKGVTQCYSCNRFHHKAENCHITPRSHKCGKEQQTRECLIQRVENRYCINCETYGHMANYSGCPKFPKSRKGTSTNTNTYTNTVNRIIRPRISYAQATNTSNSQKTQQMVPRDKKNPAVSVINQANQSNLITPLIVNNTSNGTLDLNLIIQTLQQTILALSMLIQHISNVTSLPPPTQPKKSKKEARKKELYALFEALIEDDDD
ncbi:uncharacterized protein TNCV_5067511 [Trichonephila clavipes]|nr:uncharacterized protein TNCV_5067511 [Trichonephila clavipes]